MVATMDFYSASGSIITKLEDVTSPVYCGYTVNAPPLDLSSVLGLVRLNEVSAQAVLTITSRGTEQWVKATSLSPGYTINPPVDSELVVDSTTPTRDWKLECSQASQEEGQVDFGVGYAESTKFPNATFSYKLRCGSATVTDPPTILLEASSTTHSSHFDFTSDSSSFDHVAIYGVE
eukprot:GHVU01215617.1.p1 GENE.GHVU01215617.1~~GHVU01215617.1.p1  ORF type:complete len:205 (+),score=22.91 GHVU01215617.1:86-616(+)